MLIIIYYCHYYGHFHVDYDFICNMNLMIQKKLYIYNLVPIDNGQIVNFVIGMNN